MAWQTLLHPDVERWLARLSSKEHTHVVASLELLQELGPSLGRPLVDRVNSSNFHNMKELRPPAGNIRLLFAFDPDRKAVVVVAGDKTNSWKKWYTKNIPLADRRYAEQLHHVKNRKGEK
ncbi:MAG: hypothetical protein GX678_05910 [Actinomycetales bacterium]|nr:hypothetical protein [Actinomycetales bacterium]